MTARRPSVAPAEPARPCATDFASIALLLQGGGALGAYQAGVYEELQAAGIEPTWVAGISIGAVNSAIIAGNAPPDRVVRLRDFWELVSDAGDGGLGHFWSGLWAGDASRTLANQVSAGRILVRGVPGFFEPRMPPPYLLFGSGATSYYDSTPLKATLERLVDFDRINGRQMRFSVGAVHVATGNFAYFDNETDTIRAEHVMASGALPPAFAAVEIDGAFYWDGGLVSNTPLDWVLSARSGLDTLVWQVDLWSARGPVPRDLTEVAVRIKEIQFSSRTRAATDQFQHTQRMRTAAAELLALLPPALARTPQARALRGATDSALYNIVQMVHRSATYEGESKDFEFSRRTMLDHWAAGRADARATLAHPEVLALPTAEQGVAVFDFLTPAQTATPAVSTTAAA